MHPFDLPEGAQANLVPVIFLSVSITVMFMHIVIPSSQSVASNNALPSVSDLSIGTSSLTKHFCIALCAKPKVAIKATVRTKILADMFFFDVVWCRGRSFKSGNPEHVKNCFVSSRGPRVIFRQIVRILTNAHLMETSKGVSPVVHVGSSNQSQKNIVGKIVQRTSLTMWTEKKNAQEVSLLGMS